MAERIGMDDYAHADYEHYRDERVKAGESYLGKSDWEANKAKRDQAPPSPSPAPATPAPAARPPAAPPPMGRTGGPNRADLDVASVGRTMPAPAPAKPPAPAASPPKGETPMDYPEYVRQMRMSGIEPATEEVWKETYGKSFAPAPAPGATPAAPAAPPESRPQTPSATKPPAAEPPPAPATPPADPDPALDTEPALDTDTDTTNSDTTAKEDGDKGKGNDKKAPADETDATKDIKNRIKDPNSGNRATMRDSLNKVLGIDENTKGGTKFLKHLFHAVSAFGHGFVGRDDPLLQAAVTDFRAKRDAENTAEAKKLEQIQLAQNMMAAYKGLTADQALQFIVDFGNAKTADETERVQKELMKQQQEYDAIMQDKIFAHQTAMMDQALRNELARMIRQAGINAEQAGLAMIEMARVAKAYDEKTENIDAEKFGNFMRKTGGDTTGMMGRDALMGVLSTFGNRVAGGK